MNHENSNTRVNPENTMHTITPSSMESLLSEILEGVMTCSRCCVWRGQANIDWNPYPGLYRRLLNNGYGDSDIDEILIRKYETDLLCEANGLGFYGAGGANRLDFMINLQHEGGATRFLDVTWNPFVALWFASCYPDEDVDAVVYCYQIDSNCCPLPEQIFSWDDITPPDGAGEPILFTPRRINERIKAQSASFLTCVLDGPLSEGSIFTHASKYSNIKRIRLMPGLKKEVNKWLKQYRRMRQFNVFPDFSGYARANSQEAQFARTVSSLYDESDGLFPTKFHC